MKKNITKQKKFSSIGLLIASLVLSACQTTPTTLSTPLPDVAFSVQAERLSRYGNWPVYEVKGKTYRVKRSAAGFHQQGIASWYGPKFHKKRTSSGEPYDMYEMTAAHKTLPLPSYVRVINLENNKSIIVRVNDRGPFHDNRIIDLSYLAAEKLGIIKKGTGLVDIQAVDPNNPDAPLAAISMHRPQLFLQIGAFKRIINADALAMRIKQITTRPVYIEQGFSNQHAIYRVQIGPIQTVAITDSITQKLKAAGFGKAIAMIL